MSRELSPKPYRVEWRYTLNENWLKQHEADSYEEALELATDCVRAHRGFARIIVQHVIARASK